ncbi:hypothetical protein GCM10022206_59250 [Streptomyces chiangmaiensis]
MAHTQLRLAGPFAADQRKPWEKTTRPKVVRQPLHCPARVPKPSRPGPGRPPGSKNRHPATRHDVGKTVKRPSTLYERDRTRP